MRGKYIMPVVGQVYKNRNGWEYCCLSNAAYPNEDAAQRAVELGEHQARMIRMSDGWSIIAHGLQQYGDGTVEWNYSTGGGFQKGELDRCRNMLYGAEPDMKRYFDYLDDLCNSGATNMFGAVAYLQRRFPELGFDDARARHVLIAWMNRPSARGNGGMDGDG